LRHWRAVLRRRTPPPGLPGLIPRDRIRTFTVRRPPRAVVQRFLALDDLAGLVGRALDRLGIAGAIPAHRLSPLAAGQRLAGPAITVRNVPDRLAPYRKWQRGEPSWLAEREAYFVARRGDVIVIDAGGRMAASVMGGQSAGLARDRGLAGSIVDGPVTGVAEITASGYPVWARGATTVTGHHRIDTAEINGTICCGGVQVRPGDLIVADDSGIAVVPPEAIGEVWRIVEEQARLAREIRQGRGGKGDAPALARRYMRQVSRHRKATRM
jgi:regulator of RNase E activity RraA